ncbi:hypothetical protein [Pedobacter sp. SYP-B3415]|uniref:hypothetical protein n=1 Tax=Pedobacter sp. SYP-B3415 TaxID=2496641 RepID=UPI00101DB132|nr:hypothetical protein [Pedobacter sp. SYP-B3415]
MKTDPVEIFQTIRAVLQPYAALGFVVRENSETVYDLWSEKKIEVKGQERTELHFASLEIDGTAVDFHFLPPDTADDSNPGSALTSLQSGDGHFKINELDDTILAEIENLLAIGFKKFKQNDWI